MIRPAHIPPLPAGRHPLSPAALWHTAKHRGIYGQNIRYGRFENGLKLRVHCLPGGSL